MAGVRRLSKILVEYPLGPLGSSQRAEMMLTRHFGLGNELASLLKVWGHC